MNKYYLHIVYLENCPYSEAALDFIKSNNINHEIITVNHSSKSKYKTEERQTFPQIFLKKQGKKDSLYLGGYDKLNKLYEQLENKENINNFSKKAKQRLTELFNLSK
jgi:glutaredoxin